MTIESPGRSIPSEETQLRSIIDQLADGIVIVAADGVIRFANPAAEQLFARSAHRLIGTPFGFPIAGGEPAEIDIVRTDEQPITAELRVVPVAWEGEPASLVSIRDITDRRRAEERARQIERERVARIEAEAANHAKSEFLATMSHELRTPLNAVIGYAQLLELGIGGALPPAHRQHVERILTSSRHLLGLVSEVLDLAKVDAGSLALHVASASAGATADGAAALVQPLAEARGIGFSIRPENGADVGYVGDEDRVRQVLVNLLTNAVKFTDAGGEVALEYGQTDTPDEDARLQPNAVWTYFRVRDSGIGIPADQLARIFEPFVQVRSGRTRSNDGSGLGLAISRRLARLMRGDITVASNVGAGSVFTLWLPAADVTEETPARPATIATIQTRDLRGFAAVGDALTRELSTVVSAFVARVRAECPAPGVAELKFSQLANHIGAYVANLASMLVAADEGAGQPSSVLADATDIHQIVATRHGSQRARLGWSTAALECEYRLLSEEIDHVLARNADAIDPKVLGEARAVIRQLIDKAQQVSLRAFARATPTPNE